jgi:serine protease Do
MVGATGIGQTAKLKVLRQGESREVTIKIGMLPEEEPKPVSAQETTAGDKVARLNIAVSSLTSEQRTQLELPKASGGVLIQSVSPGPAYDAGVRRGDILLRIQDQLVKDAKQLNDIVKSQPKGKSVAALIQRQGGTQFLAIKLKD